MATQVFTSAKGRFIEKAMLPIGTDALLLVLLNNTTTVVDNTLRNQPTLAAILSLYTEATFTNYARKTVTTGITITTSTTTFSQTLAFGNPTWSAAGGTLNNTMTKFLVCYKPTSSTLDSGILPLIHCDLTTPTQGTDYLVTLPSGGLAPAT